MTDDARQAILARRARFIAAALASAGICAPGGCAKNSDKHPSAPPSVFVDSPPSAGEAGDPADADAAAEAEAVKPHIPRTCLSEF
jgi:hypothetical protein